MAEYFLDTSFLIAFFDSGDDHHEKARETMQEIKKEELVISDQVFSETVNTVFSRMDHTTAHNCAEYLRKSQINVIYLNKTGFQKTCDLFQDNQISFTDCSIAAAMELLSIEKLATFDTDFKKLENIETIPK